MCLALFDVSCAALDASRRLERYLAGQVTGTARDRALSRLVEIQDALDRVVDLLGAGGHT